MKRRLSNFLITIAVNLLGTALVVGLALLYVTLTGQSFHLSVGSSSRDTISIIFFSYLALLNFVVYLYRIRNAR